MENLDVRTGFQDFRDSWKCELAARLPPAVSEVENHRLA